jgi:hypothetical protein
LNVGGGTSKPFLSGREGLLDCTALQLPLSNSKKSFGGLRQPVRAGRSPNSWHCLRDDEATPTARG